ncbi:outer membrane beta-barrel protein [Winogradskyella thalassocola]|uniref:Outer membrane protein beta-barrel domain-containing protein n=1 Tax=Winogradskyella thalassocola TaxID=262004 RepID=A0A1G7YZ64_9FLAO|nr:outer membrane beta-barrel protein [Winogradskyella thalassocola]SDH01589.1 Outer membrane protein beta-barrel domain-containing protein [Winogradskyella thalassocola]
MKKILLLALLITFSISSFAQRNDKDWFLSIGVNAINSLGTKSPINSPEDWSFNTPISAAVEFNWTDQFAIEQSITFNGFTDDSSIDYRYTNEDYNYLSLDTHVKYYFGELLFGRARNDWFNLYANAGVGFFHIDETNISANIGGGVLFWLNRNRTFGLRAQTIAKFAFNHSDSGYDNNHYQYHLQAVFKL